MEPLAFAVQSILALTILIDAGLLLFLLHKSTRNLTLLMLTFSLLSILVWSTSVLMLLTLEYPIFAHFAYAAAIALALFEFLFVLSFPSNTLSRKGVFLLGIPAGIAFGLSLIPHALFTGLVIEEGAYIIVQNGTHASLYAGIVTLLLMLPIFIIYKKYRDHTAQKHISAQLKYLLIGTSVFFTIGLITNSLLPVFFDLYYFNGLGPAFSLFYISFIIYIITRHNFLEIKKAIQRSFIYTVLLSMIICFYLLLIALAGALLPKLTTFSIVASAGLTTILGIFTIPHIDLYLRKMTDPFFFKGSYDYAQALYGLSEKINTLVLVEDVKEMIQVELANILKADKVEVTFASKDSQPEQEYYDKTLTCPILLDEEYIGSIFLGEKKSGDLYTKEDAVLIKTFSHHIALAFEKARLFKEVQEYSRELEDRVALRTAQLEELRQAQTHMMFDISHKLQNPLTIMKTQLSLLHKQLPDKDFSFFERTLEDVSAFIYDLLHLARFDEAIKGERTSQDLSAHVHELAEYFHTIGAEQGISLVTNITPDIYFTYSKKDIEELLSNLVSNAMKYIGSSTKRISIDLTQTNEQIELVVEDTGIGISTDDVPHIFDRFYRTQTTERSAIKGTGLGLAICKKIVELHGGTIEAKSALNVGTKITARFPRDLSVRSSQ